MRMAVSVNMVNGSLFYSGANELMTTGANKFKL